MLQRSTSRHKRLILSLFWLGLASTLSGCTSEAEVTSVEAITVPGATTQTIQVTIKNAYYELNGSLPTDLVEQMQRNGPTGGNPGGRHYSAWTDWYIRWSYSYNSVPNGCVIGTVKVDVTITFTFPHWNKPDDISSGLDSKWNKFLAALQTHENGHRDNGIRAGQEIYRGLSAMPAQPNCQALQTTAANTGNHLLDQFRQQDIQYDAATRHGATQGVIFP